VYQQRPHGVAGHARAAAVLDPIAKLVEADSAGGHTGHDAPVDGDRVWATGQPVECGPGLIQRGIGRGGYRDEIAMGRWGIGD
jgi:hypothetical protein